MKELLNFEEIKSWDEDVERGEELLWAGKPMIYSTDIDKEEKITRIWNFISKFFALIYVVGLNIYFYYHVGSIEGLIFFNLVCVVMYGFDYFFGHEINLKAKYAITKKSVLFKYYKRRKYKVHRVLMKNIIAVQHVGNKDETGTLYLITAKKVAFETSPILNDILLDHPVLESIPHAENVKELIQSRIKNNPPRSLSYRPPSISKQQKKIAEMVLGMLLIIMLYIGFDKYLLPLTQESADSLINPLSAIFCLISSLTLGGSIWYSKKRRELQPEQLYRLIFLNILVLITYWIIYGIEYSMI